MPRLSRPDIFSTPICFGEKIFGDEVDFNLTRNERKVFLLKIRKEVKFLPPHEMFFRPSLVDLKTYKCPPSLCTGSEVSDQFTLASAVKELPAAGIKIFSLPDPDRACHWFHNVQLYSLENTVSKEEVTSLFKIFQEKGVDGKGISPFLGKAVCDSATFLTPCLL